MESTITPIPDFTRLQEPLAEFYARVSSVHDLRRTLHRLLFESLRRQDDYSADEADSLHALFDLLLVC